MNELNKPNQTYMRQPAQPVLSRSASLDDLLTVAVQYNHGKLMLSGDEQRLLLTLLQKQAEKLDAGDRIRLNGVTLLKTMDGTAFVQWQTR